MNKSERSGVTFSDSGRSPTNFATSYIDLDFMYGRSEAEAQALRTMEGGLMAVTASGLPNRNANGTWVVSLDAYGGRVYLPQPGRTSMI